MASTIQQVAKRVSNRIRVNNSDLNVQPGSVVYDAFIDPVASEIVRQEVIGEYNSTLQSLDSILELQNDTASLDLIAAAKNTTTDAILAETSAMIESIGSNYNMTRGGSGESSGFVQFIRDTPLAAGEDVTLIQGIRVQTVNSVVFVTTESVRINASLGNLVAYGLQYAVTVPVSAIDPGIAGNVAEGEVVTITGSAPTFTEVTNTSAMAGGTATETDAQFVARIKLAWQGNNVGTRTGYEKLVLGFGPISDVLVVGAGDALMLRDNGYGGAVDIYVLEDNLKQVSETVAVIPPSGLIPLSKQPVRSIVSPTNFSVQKDTSGLAGSENAGDVAKKTSGSYPAVPFNLEYIYNSQPEDMQARLTEAEIALDNDVLMKEATLVLVDMTFRMRIKAGYDFSLVKSAVTTNITDFFDAIKIGDPLQTSDVVNVVLDTAGVDQMALPPSVMNRQDAIAAVPPILYADDVVAAGNEYLRLGTLTITQI